MVVDSTGFPAHTADASWGRYPNGTGPFMPLAPTFNSTNIPLGVEEQDNGTGIYVYPNPSAGKFITSSSSLSVSEIELQDVTGRVIRTLSLAEEGVGGGVAVDIADRINGIYFLKVRSREGVGVKKIIIQH